MESGIIICLLEIGYNAVVPSLLLYGFLRKGKQSIIVGLLISFITFQLSNPGRLSEALKYVSFNNSSAIENKEW